MPTMTEHGGLCCGIRHVFGMGLGPRREVLDSLDALLLRVDRMENSHGDDAQRLVEVVVTDGQEVLWRPALLERGFKKVVRFLNANSGNYCNVYCRHHGMEVFDPTHESPPLPAPEPVRFERREVWTEYYADLRIGRRGPFLSVENAREAYPRCRNFVSRSVFNDGTQEWSERFQ